MQKFIVKTGFWALGRSAYVLSKADREVAAEVAGLPEGFSVVLKVWGYDDIATGWKVHNGKFVYQGKAKGINPDLLIEIKSLKSAYRMIMAQLGIETAFAERRISIKGSTVEAMIITRILNRTEAYLFPKFLSKNLLKKVPAFGVREYLINLRVYTLGLLFKL